MGWLDKFLGLEATTAWALAILLAFGVIGGLVFLLYKMITRGNGKSNGTGLQEALKLDDRVDLLEDKVSQVVAGLGYLKDEVRDHSTRVNDRIDKLISQLNK